MNSDINKKLYFAAHAPSEVPKWYLNKFADNCKEDSYIWSRESVGIIPPETGFTPEGEEALYFSWRVYYAEQMVLVIEK